MIEFEHVQGKGMNSPTVPLSHGVKVGPWLYVSGMVPRRSDGSIVDDVQNDREAIQQTLRNLFSVLDSAAGDPTSIVKVNVFLSDLSMYKVLNEVWSDFFTDPYPARTTYEVAKLGLGRIEVDAVAFIDEHM